MDVETRHYSDGTRATGMAPLPDLSPDQQDVKDRKNELVARIDKLLHELMHPEESGRGVLFLANEAHGAIHDLAALISDDPVIRASAIADCRH